MTTVRVRVHPHAGVCAQCHATQPRITTVQGPIALISRLRVSPETRAALMAAAVVSGHTAWSVPVSLSCLRDFMARFDGCDPSLLQAITTMTQRMHREISAWDRLRAHDPIQIADAIWRACIPVWTHGNLQTLEQRIDAFWRAQHGLRFTGLSSTARRDIRMHVRILAHRMAAQGMTLTSARTHLQQHVHGWYMHDLHTQAQRVHCPPWTFVL